MSAHKKIDRICVIITVFTLIITLLFCNGQSLGIQLSVNAMGYENRLFDQSKVHRIDIVMDDWDSFIENCESEEYSACNVAIDGDAVKNVGIRAKGNTSLSSVKNMNSERYSFKIEFDQYEKGKSYYGLDKLCLNNIIQDNTYMKDYIAYTLMADFGVNAPLCSYADIYVNGEEWGLYLAVESVEDSFLTRNYGSQYGDLYKPDSMSFGGGRGNGMDFDMSDFMNGENTEEESSDANSSNSKPQMSFGNGQMPDFSNMELPEDFSMENMPEGNQMPNFGGGNFDGGNFGGFGMGSDDVKLKYSDDAFESYSNIFNNAKTTVTDADKQRLIQSLKSLSEQSNLESVVNVDEVLRYFVVHNFLVNGDSYTGQMIHNYYLYEEDGQLSMIPWDYNLAYGTFQGGNASSSVNSAIDTPVSGDMSDRPMVSWIFSQETYTEQYHALFSEFINSVDLDALISETASMIDSYVEKDATKFCTYEEFQKGVEAIKLFCNLRTESVKGQLDGTIPSTSDGQSADSSSLIDTSELNTSDMGTMGGNKGGFGGDKTFGDDKSFGGNFNFNQKNVESTESATMAKSTASFTVAQNNPPSGFGGNRPNGFGGNMPEDFDPSNMPNGFDGNMPEGFDPSNMPNGADGNMPEDFDPSNMPNGADGNMPGNFGSVDTSEETNENMEESVTQNTEHTDASLEEENTQSSAEKPNSERGEGRPQMGDFTEKGGQTPNSSNNTTTIVLLSASVLMLLFGLIFAKLFKR